LEVAVQVAQRWVLARLRHRRFFSLVELNGAIRKLIADLNDRPMRHLGASRRALFEALERPALLPLPAGPYAYAEWRRCRAGLDYHVEVHGHFYSVPYRLMRETIEARVTDQTLELFHQGARVASHLRNPRQHRHPTIPDHMPTPASLRPLPRLLQFQAAAFQFWPKDPGSSLLQQSAACRGSLNRRCEPLIQTETLFRRTGPPQISKRVTAGLTGCLPDSMNDCGCPRRVCA
jgi:hypothetical protein